MVAFKKIDNSGGGPGPFVYKINVVAADLADNTELDLGGDIASDIIVDDAYVVVNTAESTATTKTIDVGLLASETGGDADGFLDGISVAAAGEISATLVNATPTLGALLRVVSGAAGEHCREPHHSDSVTAKSVSITCGDASGFTEADFDIYLVCRHAKIAG